jgi:hypothetical protein
MDFGSYALPYYGPPYKPPFFYIALACGLNLVSVSFRSCLDMVSILFICGLNFVNRVSIREDLIKSSSGVYTKCVRDHYPACHHMTRRSAPYIYLPVHLAFIPPAFYPIQLPYSSHIASYLSGTLCSQIETNER